jgi:hypothetical protein
MRLDVLRALGVLMAQALLQQLRAHGLDFLLLTTAFRRLAGSAVIGTRCGVHDSWRRDVGGETFGAGQEEKAGGDQDASEGHYRRLDKALFARGKLPVRD